MKISEYAQRAIDFWIANPCEIKTRRDFPDTEVWVAADERRINIQVIFKPSQEEKKHV